MIEQDGVIMTNSGVGGNDPIETARSELQNGLVDAVQSVIDLASNCTHPKIRLDACRLVIQMVLGKDPAGASSGSDWEKVLKEFSTKNSDADRQS